MHLTLRVNGTVREADIASDDSLLTVLRDALDLTGTKYGCGEGQCGACTVLVDGQAIRSCRQNASAFQNRTITTIEGLEQNGRLHPVQEAFLAHEALQCGFCTPGMIMAAIALLAATPHPSDAQIVAAMDRNRNICRCGTYPRIVTAIKNAATRIAGAGQAPGERRTAAASAPPPRRADAADESEAVDARA
jgi:aerobic-type carbon monoxide dehydrogenase small subunit (CoxS/CutS family)